MNGHSHTDTFKRFRFIHQEILMALLNMLPTVASAFFLTTCRLVTVKDFITKMCAMCQAQMQVIILRLIWTDRI